VSRPQTGPGAAPGRCAHRSAAVTVAWGGAGLRGAEVSPVRSDTCMIVGSSSFSLVIGDIMATASLASSASSQIRDLGADSQGSPAWWFALAGRLAGGSPVDAGKADRTALQPRTRVRGQATPGDRTHPPEAASPLRDSAGIHTGLCWTGCHPGAPEQFRTVAIPFPGVKTDWMINYRSRRVLAR